MKAIILLAIMIACFQVNAQDTADLPTLQNQIDSLQQRLDEGNYIRVPKDDFEKILKNSVADEVSDSIKKWIAFLGTLIGLVGIFIAAYFKNQIRTQVDESLKLKLDTVNSRIDRQVQNEKDENLRQDTKLRELTERIDNLLASQAKFINDSTLVISKKIKEILSFAWDDIAEAKIRIASEKKFTGLDLITEIRSFLENKEIEIRKDKRISLIDTLMRCYYHTRYEERAKYKDMIELLRKYETDHELSPETYANAAIALSNSYELSGSKADRDTCIDCCDKSINRLNDYGVPYAIKLEVFMIDHKKAFDEKEKEAAVENIKRTFNAIKNNKSVILCREIIDRLDKDHVVPYLKEYIDELEKMFAAELAEVRTRV